MAPAEVPAYIDAAVLSRLERRDPESALDERNLPDFCTVLEGVSHFLYATWRLRQDHPLSLLELETQVWFDGEGRAPGEVNQAARAKMALNAQRFPAARQD